MRRHAALVFILAAHAFVVGIALLFHLRIRVSMLEAFSAYDTALPTLTAIAISEGFMPAAVGAGLSLTLAGLALPLKRSRRALLLGAGLCISSFALIFAVIAAYLPFFQPASAVVRIQSTALL